MASSSSSFPLVGSLHALGQHVHVAEPERVEKVLTKLISGGADKLQLVVDFDNTLTRVHRDGQALDNSWGVMENSPLLPADYTGRCQALKNKYIPIEIDPHLSVEAKVPHIVEWYTKGNELLQSCKVNRNMFPDMVRASNVELREGTNGMLDKLQKASVPVLVLSAGLGDLLVEVLKQKKALSDNVKVVSNFMTFDDDGVVSGIDGEMIHTYNKNENAIHDSPYFKKIEHRHNIILLGDSEGDLHMADGVEAVEAILKVGFLNNNIEKKLGDYEKLFDVVLVDDQTMSVPSKLVDQILRDQMVANVAI